MEGLAVLADIDWSAFNTVIVASGLIDGASLISDLRLVHELIGRDSLTTVAPIIIHGA